MAKLTKQHFEMLAEVMHNGRADWDKMETPARMTWRIAVSDLADMCTQSNGKFDRERFMNWCTNGKPLSKAERKRADYAMHGHGGTFQRPFVSHEHAGASQPHEH